MLDCELLVDMGNVFAFLVVVDGTVVIADAVVSLGGGIGGFAELWLSLTLL